MKIKNNPHIGSSFEDFLKEEGIYEEVAASVAKRRAARAKKKKSQDKKRGDACYPI